MGIGGTIRYEIMIEKHARKKRKKIKEKETSIVIQPRVGRITARAGTDIRFPSAELLLYNRASAYGFGFDLVFRR